MTAMHWDGEKWVPEASDRPTWRLGAPESASLMGPTEAQKQYREGYVKGRLDGIKEVGDQIAKERNANPEHRGVLKRLIKWIEEPERLGPPPAGGGGGG